MFTHIISLSGLVHTKSEEKQSPNESEGERNTKGLLPCGHADGC